MSFDFERIVGKKFVVVGDFMLDYYRFMEAKRLSPEAPVVIFSQVRDEYRLGGAANVANNLAALGAKVVFFSIVGYDWDSYAGKVNIPFDVHVAASSKPITIKERILTKRQQIARIDKQVAEPISSLDVSSIMMRAIDEIRDADAVVISDYDHGTMVPDLAMRVIAFARSVGKPIVVDSKAPDSITKYKGATMVVPNEAEAVLIAGQNKHVRVLAQYLMEKMDLKAVGITQGRHGIYLYHDDKGQLIPAHLRNEDEVADVTGAGDTVLAAVSAALACGEDFYEATVFANLAAANVVQKVGVATVDVAQLRHERSQT